MARVCTICSHPDREALESALLSGESMRAIAIRSGDGAERVSKDALSRHREHISPALARLAVAEREGAGALSAAARLEELFGRASKVLDASEAEGKASLSLAAIRELRSLVELLAKITGELDERPQVQIVNVTTSPEWLQVRGALMAALRPYPDAAQAVAGRLGQLELGVGP